MEVWVVSRIHTDDGRWRTSVRKHSDENEVCIVDPIELGVLAGVDILRSQHVDDTLSGGYVWVEFVVHVFVWMHVCDG